MDMHICRPLNDLGYVASVSEDYSEVTVYEINRPEYDLSIFGYTEAEKNTEVLLEIEYIPAYGGSEEYPFKHYQGVLNGKGNGTFPFASHMYGKVVFYDNSNVVTDSKYNGIYRIRDANCPRLGELTLILRF